MAGEFTAPRILTYEVPQGSDQDSSFLFTLYTGDI